MTTEQDTPTDDPGLVDPTNRWMNPAAYNFSAAERLRELPVEYGTPAPELVSKLPKNVAKQGDSRHCSVCGGYHRPASLHLDYVGHSDVTKVLIEVDPHWNWQPGWHSTTGPIDAFALTNPGEPRIMLGELTVLGKTIQCVGTCDSGKGPDALKELIGDLLRNGAMRFGLFVDLWSKADAAERATNAGRSGGTAKKAPAKKAPARKAAPAKKAPAGSTRAPAGRTPGEAATDAAGSPQAAQTPTEAPEPVVRSEGEQAVVDGIIEALNGIADTEARKAAKRTFVAAFGCGPDQVPNDQLPTALQWLADTGLAEQPGAPDATEPEPTEPPAGD